MSVLTVNTNNFENEILHSEKNPSFWTSGHPGAARAVWFRRWWIKSPRKTPSLPWARSMSMKNPELAQAFGVMSIPTLVAMKDGKIVNQAVGVRPKGQILDLLKG